MRSVFAGVPGETASPPNRSWWRRFRGCSSRGCDYFSETTLAEVLKLLQEGPPRYRTPPRNARK